MDGILVTFALPEEAAPFRQSWRATAIPSRVEILVGGMGAAQTTRRVLRHIQATRPALTLTCGFAGGLHPSLRPGDVLFHADPNESAAPRLQQCGARPARFHHVESIVATAQAKAHLHAQTGADAIDMESKLIRDECARLGLRSLTLRVVSDTAGEDLPVDFNRWTRPDQTLNPWAIARDLLARPALVPELIRLRRKLNHCAHRLSNTLLEFLAGESSPPSRQGENENTATCSPE